eukprot:scaffold1822_cov221-Alexandrium_tamarense.AAC.21
MKCKRNAEPIWFQELLQKENGCFHVAARTLYNSFVSCINSSENNDDLQLREWTNAPTSSSAPTTSLAHRIEHRQQ